MVEFGASHGTNGPSDILMVVFDGRNDQYVPVLDLLTPRLEVGGLAPVRRGLELSVRVM